MEPRKPPLIDQFMDWLFHWGYYNGLTALVVAALFLLQVVIGDFIRWEVGPIEAAVAADPVAGTAQGWAGHACFDQGPKKVCAFDRAN
jgi:hypothetical protein